eukprot:CAMPEP_0114563674 /NCGR_PEP_ID=MMETSP0114-20121206/13257_1 /TAXON_ID=31324 /ORGANISM="Goniomonas sp, Strain m" /LENGTH=301 /DNA_ID=CAMNT_0001749579 /DNA_START=6 /DNA_END=911 /DNA_ORIENTATION=+
MRAWLFFLGVVLALACTEASFGDSDIEAFSVSDVEEDINSELLDAADEDDESDDTVDPEDDDDEDADDSEDDVDDDISEGNVIQHLANAESLLNDLLISKENNYDYRAGGLIVWNGPHSEAFVRCSNFISLVLRHTYNWSGDFMRQWLGATSPTAARYYDKIVAQTQGTGVSFKAIHKVTDFQAGDILAVKYLDGTSGSTGHMYMVAEAPKVMTTKSPVAEGTTQYSCLIIDASKSGHGSKDTRKLNPSNYGSRGVGQGTMRLYADAHGNIHGHTWSTYSNSRLYLQSQRALVAGRVMITE